MNLKKRILVVEDDVALATALLDNLLSEGYDTQCVNDGRRAIASAGAFKPDLIVLDLMLPGVSGFDLCRAFHDACDTPILVLTARSQKADKIRCLDYGADDYLTKPFEFRELLARLRALLRRTGRLQPAELVVADLIVDTAGQNVSRAGRKIPMTAKEYALLEFLARNAGRVVGRAEIAEHVWDDEFDPFSNLIEVYVNRVRRKIDAGSANPLLHTRRGAGYVLSADSDLPGDKKSIADREHDDV
jgi:two-component system copper resistance phosphate regulon response regulator CusR